jgi:NhaP-type Na+/H+ and K+/H+ antiporter
MNAVKEFKGSYVKLFSNALHNGFHTTVWKYLRSLEDKTKIHLSDELLTEYGTNIAAETELNRETRAHVNTAALNEADAKRDKAMSYLFNVIEAAKEAVVPDIQAVSEDEYLLDGGILIDDLNEELGLKLETENYDTLSGYLIEKLGHIPEKDDRDTVFSDNLVFTVEEVRDNRITKARLKIEPAAAEEDGERSGKKKRRESEDAAEEE